MSIEADAQKDLALNAEDAENVVGGKKKQKAKAKKKPVATKAAAKSLPMVNVQTNPTATESSYYDDCDDPAAAAVADSSSSQS